MSWLKIDDHFPEHEKVSGLHDRAFRFHITALCYCSRNLTDGILDDRAIRVVAAIVGTQPKRWVNELVQAGLWLREDDGYRIKDFLEYNRSKEQVKEDRRKARERMSNLRGSGERSGEHAGEVRFPSPVQSPTEDLTAVSQFKSPDPVTRLIVSLKDADENTPGVVRALAVKARASEADCENIREKAQGKRSPSAYAVSELKRLIEERNAA